jgi:speckle-type POZ protein
MRNVSTTAALVLQLDLNISTYYPFTVKSQFFSKMFQMDMKEAHERNVEINDAEPDVVREMLRFLYTGEVENMTKVFTNLYELAHRYLIEDLKNVCVTSMIEHLSAENALELYSLAKQYDISLLSEQAKQILIE